jgi:predicted dehydrogenase
VLAALATGKHVYCEWPLGNGLAESIELAEAAREAGTVAVVGLQGRVAPAVRHVRRLVEEGYVGEVLSTSLTSPCWVYGGTLLPGLAFMADKRNGATMHTVQLGHISDAMAYCIGELSEVRAVQAVVRPRVIDEATGDVLDSTAPDQIALSGRLEQGGVASIHLRGGRSAEGLRWVIQGTEGELLFTSPGAHFNNDDEGAPSLFAARPGDATMTPLETPKDLRWVPADTPGGPPYNVAQFYMRLARDIREGTHTCPTFDHAVARHRLLDAVEEAVETGAVQHYDAGPDSRVLA